MNEKKTNPFPIPFMEKKDTITIPIEEYNRLFLNSWKYEQSRKRLLNDGIYISQSDVEFYELTDEEKAEADAKREAKNKALLKENENETV